MVCITGIARHSLGEALVGQLLRPGTDWRIIGMDCVANTTLSGLDRFQEMTLDLDALNDRGGFSGFASSIGERLAEFLDVNGRRPVHWLVQSAGVYDRGTFVGHDLPRRRRLLGVNLIGHIEVLHAVMRWNTGLGADNSAALSHIDIGSFQGLIPRAERALYVLSKGAGIDLAAAMHAGGELRRSLYFAPGPIDTHMLHRNHWVVTAGGSADLFEALWARGSSAYKAVFIDGIAGPLLEMANDRGENIAETAAAFDRYSAARREALLGGWGILDVDVCAGMLAAMVETPERFRSGVYVASSRTGVGPRLRFVEFERLSRLRVVEAEGNDVAWEAPSAGGRS